MNNLGIDSLSIGISASGMSEYKEALKAELLVATKTKLEEERNNIMNIINTGWQGVARNRFDDQLKKMCDEIGNDLEAEYKDLEARLDELEAFYFNQDKSLLEDR